MSGPVIGVHFDLRGTAFFFTVPDLAERGVVIPAPPQAGGLEGLEDCGQGPAGPVGARAGVTTRP